MRRTVAFLAVFFLSFSAFADDERAVRRNLIRELLAVIDTKQVTQETVRSLWPSDDASVAFLERVFARIDYESIAEEVFAPRFDETFTTAELKELLAFFKTKAGHKSFALLVELTVSGGAQASSHVHEISSAIHQEMEKEELQKKPWKRTMADLRAVATAAEAYATDTNRYPAATSYQDLKGLLVPIYLKDLPEKDVWGTAFSYSVSSDGASYRFASAGADGQFGWDSRQVSQLPEDFEAKAMESLDADIIFQDGIFVQFPAQTNETPEP